MINDRDGLAAYRRLEFPNETAESWPIAERERDQVVISYLRVAHESDADAEKKIAA
jgi:hypothetical protein